MSVSVGVATLVAMAAVLPVSAASADESPADRTALILGGTTIPTPDAAYVDVVMNQYIEPTHPNENIRPVAVTTPQELWPATGVGRLAGLALGPSSLWGLGGPGWPDEPWWKLSGLFDLTANQSVQVGAADLDAAIARNGSDHLVIYGLSQGAGVANVSKKRLAERYPAGTKAPDIDFVLSGDPNLPNGGLMSRFAGVYIPILDFPFNGPAATDTQFDTVEINRQYDGFTDFPLYPLNLVADLNAALGIVYLHAYSLDVSLPPDPTTSPAYQGTHGDTDYYFFETQDLPLFGPARSLGVPESAIDVVEPSAKVIVDQGYDRSIPAWEPTPARFPTLDPASVVTDFVDAVGAGVNNAMALSGLSPLLTIPAP
ncbi:PE-PPE domain-containing protein [Nocardia sp. 348MFTsu5.1]|uniref:PE-PPE domain-containing protein n=2 Tax=Nocardia sp. 348MFTsu5.1 TaxID=1172185 RepID=UPI00035C83F2|nr:PE-PPE domain-containing protein [Nocardia sp. 348MFTsu5.1]